MNENRVNVNETCGVFINDVIMEKTCDKNPIVQTKISRKFQKLKMNNQCKITLKNYMCKGN
jgi:hypothetical protein